VEEQVLHGLQDMLFPLVGDVSGGAWPATRSGGGRGGCSRSRRGAGERGRIGHVRASWKCGGAIAVPNLAGGGAEGGRRR
jgi:hypothetical protein